MNNDKKLSNVIEALSSHEDTKSIEVLERVGTNCPDDEVRRLTAKALINKNTRDSLSLVIVSRGKGINDLSTNVAMSAINELLALDDKTKALELLTEAEQNHPDECVRETARSVKALMQFS